MINFKPGRAPWSVGHLDRNVAWKPPRCKACGDPLGSRHDQKKCVEAWLAKVDDEARKLKGGAGR